MVRLAVLLPIFAVAALGAVTPAPAAAASSVATVAERDMIAGEVEHRVDSKLRGFYASRGYRPLWVSEGGVSAAGLQMGALIATADLDGLKPKNLKYRDLARALERAQSGKISDLARAEIALSNSYGTYVTAVRKLEQNGMIYANNALAPAVPTVTSALETAAAARSLGAFVSAMGWMHPLYAPLRKALHSPGWSDAQRQQIWANLARIRAIPANPADRYVLVDAAGARLWMYENGRPADSMKVVVGKPDEQTPAMAGFLRYAIVNPYWNIPPDLVRSRIAVNVLERGQAYLQDGGYQVMGDWSENAAVADPGLVDWHAVAAGTQEVRVRQLPGATNFMGRVKYMFPNDFGIYLHDTPDKALMLETGRQFSSGCVRLEDAARFGRWLLGKPLPARVKLPEQQVTVPVPVPIYITYLTVAAEGDTIAFRADPYARDNPVQLASAKRRYASSSISQ